jgi:hypothetical protein
MGTLMQMQNSFDIAEARKRERGINVLSFKGRTLAAQSKSV